MIISTLIICIWYLLISRKITIIYNNAKSLPSSTTTILIFFFWSVSFFDMDLCFGSFFFLHLHLTNWRLQLLLQHRYFTVISESLQKQLYSVMLPTSCFTVSFKLMLSFTSVSENHHTFCRRVLRKKKLLHSGGEQIIPAAPLMMLQVSWQPPW